MARYMTSHDTPDDLSLERVHHIRGREHTDRRAGAPVDHRRRHRARAPQREHRVVELRMMMSCNVMMMNCDVMLSTASSSSPHHHDTATPHHHTITTPHHHDTTRESDIGRRRRPRAATHARARPVARCSEEV